MVNEGAALLDRRVTSVTPPHFSTGVYSAEERAKVRRHLEEYCQLDTLAMVWLADKLHELAACPWKPRR